LTSTRYGCTSSRLCTNQSPFHSSGPRALATLLQYYCTAIGLYMTPHPTPVVYAIHLTFAMAISCKGQGAPTSHNTGGAEVHLRGRIPAAGFSHYKIFFYSTFFVHESTIFFSNIPLFGPPPPPFHRPLCCAIYCFPPTPLHGNTYLTILGMAISCEGQGQCRWGTPRGHPSLISNTTEKNWVSLE